MIDGIKRRLGVEGIKNRFHQKDIHASIHQAANLLGIGFDQFHKIHRAKTGIVNIRTYTGGLVGRSYSTRHKTRLVWIHGRDQISLLFGQTSRSHVKFITQFFHAVIGHGDTLRIEGIRFQNIRSGLQVVPVNLGDDIGPAQAEQFVVALNIARPIRKPLATIIRLGQFA